MRFPVSIKKEEALLARMATLGIQEVDLDEQFVRSQGPGGQHANKTSTCVILIHKPTGLQVKQQTERSQGLNRFFARRRLVQLIENQKLGKHSPQAIERSKIRKQKKRRKRRKHHKLEGLNRLLKTCLLFCASLQ